MPIPSTPPQPPVVIQQPSQPQPPVYVPYPVGTPQNPSTTASDLRSESTSSNKSRSASDSSSVNSASQNNINYTQNSNVVKVDGIHIPAHTLNLYGGVNDDGYSSPNWNVGVGVNFTLGGTGRANSMLDKRLKITQLQYERELAGACASIEKDSFIINPNSPVATELAQCGNIIRRKEVVQVAHVAQQDDRLTQLQLENQELRQQLQLILQKLDQDTPTVDGGGF